MSKPGSGYSISKSADVPMNDSYKAYSQTMGNDEIWSALTTEAGRQAIGAQMAVPIRQLLDYVGTARKFFEIDVLAQGQIARYDKDINSPAFVMSKNGRVDRWDITADYVDPQTWEIFAPAEVRLNQIQQRRFNILDRTQERIRISVQVAEDSNYLALADTTAASNTGSTVYDPYYGSSGNPIVTSASGCSKDFLNQLSSVVMDHDLPLYAYLMRFSSFKDIRGWSVMELDEVTMREILQTGLYGQIWGIDIVVSRLVTSGSVYANAEPRFYGVMPVRTDLILMPDDDPKQATIGYVGYEEIGFALINAQGQGKGTHTGT